ncbi:MULTISPECIES: alpha/beta hydrolase [Staphylococcus]|uniref:alpha/beta fold hydrolase n=1 Tax=Staphylococcus TaxID=1279 RepID=UPI00059792CD|nr:MULTISPECIES: alpha/beta hydrolase [Staphylococcus]KIJ86538.1 hydrolase [Staphylococcus saprophyticus]MBF2752260.1 alpha/beta hydrolase [Staphylococcus saprophyticus]MBN6095618.1 alpha/beta hydrolase [Staphylococcus saprophyticus]MBN6096065.1 alpha/beta hydrolase [Staphylococcus saprophyticus]MBN6099088.1 alpha/beta hydrolase [Staphylococcus saprophyticus]
MTHTLALDGATINYYKEGQGPVLILVPGANGTGDIFLPLIEQLKNHFTVVAIDRRDYGHSKLTEPLPERAKQPDDDYRIKRDAQDVAELAKHLSDEPIYLLGSSSGAIVTMHVLKDYPEIIKEIAFHEPPINTFLPDSTYWKEKNDAIVNQVLTEGLQAGMKTFAQTLHIAPIDAKSMSQPVSEDDTAQKEQYERMMFWAAYEIRQYTHSDITLADLAQYKDKVTLLNGTDSKGSFPQDVNFYISEQTGINIVDIPGGHLGYVQKPEGFAEVLLNLWT